MSSAPDWPVWGLALLVAALLVWFFWHTGASILRLAGRLVATIQTWPQTRRAMTEAEAQAGGRYPLWFRALRVVLILTLIGLLALLLWRRM